MKRVKTATVVAVGLALLVSAPALGANIIWVTDDTDAGNPPSPDDIGFKNLLEANGHTVDRQTGQYWRTLDAGKIAELNAADLVIVSRDTDSGQYDDGSEPTDWNSVTTPLIQLNQYLLRSSRWKWLDSTGTPGTGDGVLEVVDPTSPIFDGLGLNAGDTVDIATSNTPLGGTGDVGNGELIAIDPDNGNAAIAFWQAGTEFYSGGGQTAGGDRLFFGAGLNGNDPKGALNLTADGEKMFLNAVDDLTTVIPEPVTMLALAGGLVGLGGYVRRRRQAGA